MIVTAGKTSVSIFVYFVDDDSGTAPGEGTTGLLFSDIETGGSASYVRQGGVRVDFALITLASASAAYAAGGFILVDDTNMPGLYRVDIPNAAFASGVDQVVIDMVAAAGKNTLMRPKEVDITDVDLRDAASAGLTNLNATITSRQPAGDVDLNADQSGVTIGTVDNVADKTGYALSTAGILAIWHQLEAAVVTASTMGLKIKTNLNATISSRQASGSVDLNADQSGVTVGTVTTLTNKTGFSLSVAGILAIWHQAVAAIVTASTIGKLLIDAITTTRMAELDPANLPADIADVPTVAEFNARTIASAAYFDPTADSVIVGTIDTDVIDAASLATGAIDKIRDGLLPTQNVAFDNIEFLFVSGGDHVTPVTGATGLAVTRSIDGGAFGAGTGTGPAEVGNGIYQYDASAADMNGGIITFRFTASGGTPAAPDDRFLTIVTGGAV